MKFIHDWRARLRKWWSRQVLDGMGYCPIHLTSRTQSIDHPGGTTTFVDKPTCPACFWMAQEQSNLERARRITQAQAIIDSLLEQS